MLNRTNRTLSATTHGLNLGTRSLACASRRSWVSTRSIAGPCRIRHAHQWSAQRAGVAVDRVVPVIPGIIAIVSRIPGSSCLSLRSWLDSNSLSFSLSLSKPFGKVMAKSKAMSMSRSLMHDRVERLFAFTGKPSRTEVRPAAYPYPPRALATLALFAACAAAGES